MSQQDAPRKVQKGKMQGPKSGWTSSRLGAQRTRTKKKPQRARQAEKMKTEDDKRLCPWYLGSRARF